MTAEPISGTPDQSDLETLTIELTAYDGLADVSDLFTLEVREVNDPPSLSSIPNKFAMAGESMTCNATGTDEEGPVTYSLDATSLGNGITINSSTGEINWTPSSGRNI